MFLVYRLVLTVHFFPSGAPCPWLVSIVQWNQWHQLLHWRFTTHAGLPVPGQGRDSVRGQWPDTARFTGQTQRSVYSTQGTALNKLFMMSLSINLLFWHRKIFNRPYNTRWLITPKFHLIVQGEWGFEWQIKYFAYKVIVGDYLIVFKLHFW
jgi:hypothetical protein